MKQTSQAPQVSRLCNDSGSAFVSGVNVGPYAVGETGTGLRKDVAVEVPLDQDLGIVLRVRLAGVLSE